jgi:SAM-dependent methyltransferase
MISKDYIFKKNGEDIEFVGDFNGFYENESDPWGQSGGDKRLGEYYAYSRKNIVSNLSKNNIKTALEVGSGLGYVVDYINKNSSCICEGSDISDNAINKSSVLFEKYNFYCMDIQDKDIIIPKKYDAVIVNQVLWYILEDFNIVFENILKLLNVDGYLIISQAFLDEQKYDIDIINGFGGLIQYVQNTQKQRFKLLKAEYYSDKGLLHNDGILIAQKL